MCAMRACSARRAEWQPRASRVPDSGSTLDCGKESRRYARLELGSGLRPSWRFAKGHDGRGRRLLAKCAADARLAQILRVHDAPHVLQVERHRSDLRRAADSDWDAYKLDR